MEKRIKELEIALSQQQKLNEKLLDGLVTADKNNKRILGIVEELTINVYVEMKNLLCIVKETTIHVYVK